MSRPKTTEQFIKEAIILCKNVFLDFSKVEYKNTSTKVTIICHKKDANGIEHGEFKIKPNDFLSVINLAPTFDVIIITVFLKFTVLP